MATMFPDVARTYLTCSPSAVPGTDRSVDLDDEEGLSRDQG